MASAPPARAPTFVQGKKLGDGLDPRLQKALNHLGWTCPTLVQAESIPLALQGKDILARARTGSGKTGAYAIPIVQKLLDNANYIAFGAAAAAAQFKTDVATCKAAVLVPSRELVDQVYHVLLSLTMYAPSVRIVALTADVPIAAQKTLLAECPQIVVATPARLALHLKAKNISIRETLEFLVVDEADLIFSYGHAEDIKAITAHLPNICQGFLMSATLTPEVDGLKQLMLHSPVLLKLEEDETQATSSLAQFSISCVMSDKFLVCMALIKLQIIPGKTLFFVNDVNRCFQLKLFFEQFSLSAAVLNSELPQNSRMNIIHQFNRGGFNYLIATDESFTTDGSLDSDSEGEDEPREELGEDEEDDAAAASDKKKKRKKSKMDKKKKKNDKDYNVARGVDFVGVETVVNFDMPLSRKAYIHRIGRTARGGRSGTALTLVSPSEHHLLQRLMQWQSERNLSMVLPLDFDRTEIEGFRYRCEDALARVTKKAIKNARLKELELELLHSAKLRSHFEENPKDLEALRHDKVLNAKRVQKHLGAVPTYLVPEPLQDQFDPRAGIADKQKKRKKAPLALLQAAKKRARRDPLRTLHFAKKDGSKKGASGGNKFGKKPAGGGGGGFKGKKPAGAGAKKSGGGGGGGANKRQKSK